MKAGENSDALREAFQGLADTTPSSDSEQVEPELLWRAVAGELPADQRRELVERISRDPQVAESWRLAKEIYASSQALGEEKTPEAAPGEPLPWRRWLAAAAAIIVVAFLGQVVLRQLATEEAPIYRDAGMWTVRTELPDRATVPRVAAVLSWELAGISPELDTSEVRYTLRVQLPDLTPLATVRDLEIPRYQLPQESLSDLPAGQEVLWQVDAELPNGATISSPTFVAQIQ